ncbi:hypothetical protein [Saccharopolyspora aridisoli]|nr:hypothetical protein [Saccharopolyspora aridisoli]
MSGAGRSPQASARRVDRRSGRRSRSTNLSVQPTFAAEEIAYFSGPI